MQTNSRSKRNSGNKWGCERTEQSMVCDMCCNMLGPLLVMGHTGSLWGCMGLSSAVLCKATPLPSRYNTPPILTPSFYTPAGSCKTRCLLPPKVKQRAMPMAPIASNLGAVQTHNFESPEQACGIQQHPAHMKPYLLAVCFRYASIACMLYFLVPSRLHTLAVTASTGIGVMVPVCVLHHCCLLAEWGAWCSTQLIFEAHTLDDADDVLDKLLRLLLRCKEALDHIARFLAPFCTSGVMARQSEVQQQQEVQASANMPRSTHDSLPPSNAIPHQRCSCCCCPQQLAPVLEGHKQPTDSLAMP